MKNQVFGINLREYSSNETNDNPVEASTIEFKVYPNPVIDMAVFELNQASVHPFQLNVYSANGQLVTTKIIPPVTQNFTINLRDLNNGKYFIELAGKDQRAVYPVVKQ